MVSFHLWRVRRPALPRTAWHVLADRVALRGAPGLRFGRLLGTATGFRPRDADPTRWALLTCWSDHAALAAFQAGAIVRSWDLASAERWRATLAPVSSRGRWSRRMPFGTPDGASPDGPVAALTRARLRPTRARRFRRAVPAVAADLAGRPGLALALGVGELPIGLQGTFSVWRSAAALSDFAYDGAPHRAAARATPIQRWYAEELFARFAVLDSRGTVDGREPLP